MEGRESIDGRETTKEKNKREKMFSDNLKLTKKKTKFFGDFFHALIFSRYNFIVDGVKTHLISKRYIECILIVLNL